MRYCSEGFQFSKAGKGLLDGFGRLLSNVFRGAFAILVAGTAVLSTVRSVSATEIHVVNPGETLSQIAVRYGTTVTQLRQLNNLHNVNFVWYGQRLVVDGGATVSASAGSQNYTVRPGDSLTKIARRYGISVGQLAQLNGMPQTRWLSTGQVLRLPAAPSSFQAASAQSPDSLDRRGVQSYTVQRGDSLTKLAQRLGVSVSQLMSLNNMTALRWIYVGQVLRVPGRQLQVEQAQVEPVQVEQANPPAPAEIAPAQLFPAPVFAAAVGSGPAQTVVHTVQNGESLSAIAERYGVDPGILVRVNGLSSRDVSHAGQTLRIPSEDALRLIADLYPRLDQVEYPTLTERWIEVDLSEQIAVAYEGGIPVRSFVISSGVGNTPTVTGTFRIWAKVAMQDMQGGSRAAGTYYHLKDVRNVQYFFKEYGIHGTYWHNNFGAPMSHGCVNMTEEDAEWLFAWTSPTVYTDDWLFSSNRNPGTIVMVHH